MFADKIKKNNRESCMRPGSNPLIMRGSFRAISLFLPFLLGLGDHVNGDLFELGFIDLMDYTIF